MSREKAGVRHREAEKERHREMPEKQRYRIREMWVGRQGCNQPPLNWMTSAVPTTQHRSFWVLETQGLNGMGFPEWNEETVRAGATA